ELRLLVLAVGRILRRPDPLSRPLEEGRLVDPADESREHLHGRRPRAHDADPRAVEAHVVVRARAVERGALELVEALEVGELGMVQHTGGRDDDVDVVAVPALRLDAPRAVFEAAARDRVAEPDLPLDAVLVRDLLEVSLD